MTSNEDWITDNELGDPVDLPHIPGYMILVRPHQVGTQTKGGLLMTKKSQDDVQFVTTVGKVMSLGDEAYNNKTKPWCKVGDYVTYARYAGSKCYHKGYKLLMINDDEVQSVVSSPDDIDPNFDVLSGAEEF